MIEGRPLRAAVQRTQLQICFEKMRHNNGCYGSGSEDERPLASGRSVCPKAPNQ